MCLAKENGISKGKKSEIRSEQEREACFSMKLGIIDVTFILKDPFSLDFEKFIVTKGDRWGVGGMDRGFGTVIYTLMSME